jgi:hypothetical protein
MAMPTPLMKTEQQSINKKVCNNINAHAKQHNTCAKNERGEGVGWTTQLIYDEPQPNFCALRLFNSKRLNAKHIYSITKNILAFIRGC